MSVQRNYAALLAALVVSGAANAAVISPSGVSAFASNQYVNGSDQRTAQKAVDGTGMTGDAHAVGNSTGNQWLTNNVAVANQWLVADLGDTYQMESLRLWNSNESGYTNRGVRAAKIWVTTGGSGVVVPTAGTQGFDFAANGWTQVGASAVEFAQATGLDTYEAPPGNTLSLSGYTAHYVAVDVDSNWRADTNGYVGIAEIRFAGAIPEPGALSLAGVSAGSVLLVRRRRAR